MTVLNVVFSIFLLIISTWIAIFGGVGGLLARARGGTLAVGIAWGVVLGPIGWLIVVWATRGDSRELRRPPAAVPEPEWLTSGASWDD